MLIAAIGEPSQMAHIEKTVDTVWCRESLRLPEIINSYMI